jgi:1-acyl-sn-glycerol-3-phosphate acyltransferase
MTKPAVEENHHPMIQHDRPQSAGLAPFASKSPRLYRGFGRYCRWYVRRHFNALRLTKPGFPAVSQDEPMLVYLNHPSWWDPLVGLTLAQMGFADRDHYAPIDAAALRQYAFFARLGFFGIDPASPSGGARFLRLGQRVMTRSQTALWVTAEGHFTDPRRRPVTLQRGVAHLAKRVSRGVIVPLALEYPFWQEKKPEALGCFGEPIEIAAQPERSVEGWHALLSDQLERTMDSLAALAMRQNAADWHTLLAGRSGTTPAYDLWRAVRARLRGERFSPSHREATRHD